MAADDRHLSSRDGTVLPWPRSVDARWPLLHVLRGGGAFVLPSRHGESAAFVATPVSPLIRRASADAWRRENNRTACVRAVGSPDRTAAAGRGRPGGKKRGLANLTLTGHGLTWNVWMVASLSLSFRFISLWTLRRQGTCVLSCEYTVHCLWLDAWAGLERYVDISLD